MARVATDTSPRGARSDGDGPRLEIELDSQTGRLEAGDARLFGASGRVLGSYLVAELCGQPGVRRAEFDSRSFRCRVEFDLSSSEADVMAGIFVDSLREATHRARRRGWFRRDPKWVALVGYRHHGGVSSWETYVDQQEQLRLMHAAPPGGRLAATDLTRAISDLEGVGRCDVSRWQNRMTIVLTPATAMPAERTMRRVETLLEGRPPARIAGPARPTAAQTLTPQNGRHRFTSVALGAGSITLAIVGLVVPGIPTLPFLLAASYFFARSFPALDDKLRRLPLVGPILSEWENHGGITGTSKAKLMGLTVAIVAFSAILAPIHPLTLSALLLATAMSLYTIARMPAWEPTALLPATVSLHSRPDRLI
jgi:uncharacterized membrane protein YbaN (DUF454 family)